MPENSTKFVAETLPSSSELTVLGSDVSSDNPFRLLLSGNEADGETLLDSSHFADLRNRKVDSNIQEVAETLLCSSEPKVLENRGTLHGSPDLNQEDGETLQRSSRLMKEEDDETLQGSLVSNIPENEFEMGPNLEDEDYLDIVATPELDEKYLYTRKRNFNKGKWIPFNGESWSSYEDFKKWQNDYDRRPVMSEKCCKVMGRTTIYKHISRSLYQENPKIIAIHCGRQKIGSMRPSAESRGYL
ncbi:hypothetical protein JTB14_022714 [Gonioctena quinquepunctata]|nr:hypothetical protein JTB14_022714 [Gonioctena quinquepunctata]